ANVRSIVTDGPCVLAIAGLRSATLTTSYRSGTTPNISSGPKMWSIPNLSKNSAPSLRLPVIVDLLEGPRRVPSRRGSRDCAMLRRASRETKRPRSVGATRGARRRDQANAHVESVAIGTHLAGSRDARLPIAARQFELAREQCRRLVAGPDHFVDEH